MLSAEQAARQNIDRLLQMAGWHVCEVAAADIHAARGVAIREFPLTAGFGFADYLLYIDGSAAGVIEAKKEGATLTGVEIQSGPSTHCSRSLFPEAVVQRSRSTGAHGEPRRDGKPRGTFDY